MIGLGIEKETWVGVDNGYGSSAHVKRQVSLVLRAEVPEVIVLRSRERVSEGMKWKGTIQLRIKRKLKKKITRGNPP